MILFIVPSRYVWARRDATLFWIRAPKFEEHMRGEELEAERNRDTRFAPPNNVRWWLKSTEFARDHGP